MNDDDSNLEKELSNMTPQMLALYCHWLRASAIMQNIFCFEKDIPNTEDLPPDFLQMAKMQSSILSMEVYYALLYVVVEGYRDMGYKAQSIDELLIKEEYVEQLRRFRNAIFHFQNTPISEKLLNFLEAKDSEHWIKKLHAVFEKFFHANLPVRNILAALKECK